MNGDEIAVYEKKANIVRSIFDYYLAGASLGKAIDMLEAKGIFSPTGNPGWTGETVDKILANAKYIPIVGKGYIWMLNLKRTANAI